MKLIKNMVVLFLVIFFFAVVYVSFDLDYTGNIVNSNFNTRYAIENTDEVISSYNQNFEKIPNFARTLLGNERINMVVNMNDGSQEQLGIITKEGKIVSYSKKALAVPTVIVTTSEDVINTIASSSKPADSFADSVNSNKIKIEPKTALTGAKVYTAKVFVIVRNLF